jgi:hypothetical protein
MTAPIEFSYDVESRIRTATFRGVVGDRDLLTAYEELLRDPDYAPEAHDLVDLRRVERFEVTTEALRRLIDMFRPIDRLGHRTRLAIVAGSDHAYGMGRMYEMMRGDDVPEEIEVFRDMDAALRWLGTGGGSE